MFQLRGFELLTDSSHASRGASLNEWELAFRLSTPASPERERGEEPRRTRGVRGATRASARIWAAVLDAGNVSEAVPVSSRRREGDARKSPARFQAPVVGSSGEVLTAASASTNFASVILTPHSDPPKRESMARDGEAVWRMWFMRADGFPTS